MALLRVALAAFGILALLGTADAFAARHRDRYSGHQARVRTGTYAVPARSARVMRMVRGGHRAHAPQIARDVRIDTQAMQVSRPMVQPARASRLAQASHHHSLLRGS